MTRAEVIEMLKTEKACVERQDRKPQCNRYCESCDLCMPIEKVLEGYELAIQALEQTRWMPVSERLPEQDGDYFVCYEEGYQEDYGLPNTGIVGFEVYCESFGYWHEHFDHHTMGSLGSDWEKIPVVAWMSLPIPYKGVE